MTVAEAAKVIGCSDRLVYQLCAARRLGHRRVGLGAGKVVIDPADVAEYLSRTRVEAGPQPKAPPRGKAIVVRDVLAEWKGRRKQA